MAGGSLTGKALGLGLSMGLLTRLIPVPPVYLVCNTTLCALKQPRDFCCVCVEAKEVPALVVKTLWEELGLKCHEKIYVGIRSFRGRRASWGWSQSRGDLKAGPVLPFTILSTGEPFPVLSTPHRQTPTSLCPQGHLSVMAAQSVYDTSMPRPSRKMVRGEILPSAWILQPVTVEGKEVTRVIYLAQVINPLWPASQHRLTWSHSPLGFFSLAVEHPSVPRPFGLRPGDSRAS